MLHASWCCALCQESAPNSFFGFFSLVQVELGRKQEVVVYDQNSKEAGHLSKDGFVHILMGKLESTFHKVSLLTGNPSSECFFCFFFSNNICSAVRRLLPSSFLILYLNAALSCHTLVSRCQ